MLIESVKIFLFVVLAVVGYAVVHDQLTARICLEYFTIAHEPTIVKSDSPTVVGLAWGIYSTWWVGVVFGVASATLAQIRFWPRVAFRELVGPVVYMVLTIAIASLVVGAVAYLLAEHGDLEIGSLMASVIEPEKHSGFVSNRWSHRAAHAVGLFGGSAICAGIWVVRKRRSERSALNRT